MASVPQPAETRPASLRDLASYFLRLSLVAFGGPLAHIALMEDELVTRRKWLTREHFMDLYAAANLIPGPSSTETAIHVGYAKQGIIGAIVAGASFIIPSFLLTLVLSILYIAYGSLPQVDALLWGIKPVVVAIIAHAAYRLIPTALKDRALIGIALVAFVAVGPLHLPAILVMVGAGVAYVLIRRVSIPAGLALFGLVGLHPMLAAAGTAVSVGLWDLFAYFLRLGAVIYGSGYVLVAYLQQDVVTTFHWLTPRQLLDAIAIGQVTPGPVSTSAAVVGAIVAGVPGAIVSTIGIFLPAFVLVILTAPLVPKIRASKPLSAFLAGVNASVISVIVATLIDLTQAAARPPDGTGLSLLAIVLGVVSLVLLIRTKINPTWLILVGGVLGLAQNLLTR